MKCLHWFGSRKGRLKVLANLTGGIVLPVIGYIVVSPSLNEAGALLSPLPRLRYLYTIAALAMLTLGFWMAVGSRTGKWAAFLGGVLLLGSLLAVGIGVALIVRFSDIIGLVLCVPVMLAFFVYISNAVGALREAGKGASYTQVAVLVLVEMLAVILLSLVVYEQPWELVQCFPDCQAADLSDNDLSYVYLSGCDGNPDLSYANLANTDLSHAFLGHCDLNLQGVDMRGANLSHANLNQIDLRGADLRDTNLEGTSLFEVNLFDADLRGANLEGATLYMVYLIGADLRDSQLSFESEGRVVMDEADLRGADLQRANLGLGTVYLDRARYDTYTKWPQGFDPAELGAVFQE